MVLRRDFDAGERLMTQAGILWAYLGKAIAGIPGRLGIYHDDIEVVRSFWSFGTVLAVAAWVAVIGAAFRWRRAWPLFSFAVLWFVGGHILESTLIPLELYFEHRNYLPIAGPVIALVAFLLTHSEETRRYAKAVLPLLLVANVFFLYSFATLQGSTSVAARYWALKHPDSMRASLNLAKQQYVEEGVQPAFDTISSFVSRNPKHAYLQIFQLDLGCKHFADQLESSHVDEVIAGQAETAFSFMPAQMLSNLYTTSLATGCAAVPVESVLRVADAVLANPRYRASPEYNKLHYMFLAFVSRTQGDLDGAVAHIESALEHQRTPQVTQIMAITLAEQKQYDRAREFIAAAESDLPTNPIRAWQWRRSIAQIYDFVDAVERRDLLTQ